MGLCSVWVAINAAIERTRVVHAGPRHEWAVPTLGGVGGGRVVACGRVVGVVAGVEEGRSVEPDGRGDFGVLDALLK